jgi:putative oxidoreductase
MAFLVTLAVRYLLVMLFFPFSALDKLLNFRGAVAQARERFASPAVATALIVVGVGIEVLLPLAILTGTADRLAAFVMAGYCGVTALLWKPFWATGDFWRAGDSRGRDLFWDFLKNFGLAGGFLLLTFGPTTASAPGFLAAPLGSTHPYSITSGNHTR